MPQQDVEFTCLYNCGSGAPSTQEYHILPYSASQIELVLPQGVVCDNCNRYFGNKLENYFCHYHPGVGLKSLYVARTRKGKPPKTFLENGEITAVDIPDEKTKRVSMQLSKFNMEMEPGKSIKLHSEIASKPFKSRLISRTLAKIALELIHGSAELPYDTSSEVYGAYKRYIRFGEGEYIWFTYRIHDVSRKQSLPSFHGFIEHQKISAGCVYINFPGIQYQIPVPPIPPIDKFTISDDYRGVICAEDREYEAYRLPVEVEIELYKP